LIIVDDGSSDGTREKISSYNDERIIYIYQENRGVSAARNLGIEKASGEFLSFVDSDDELVLDAYERLLAVASPDIDAVMFGSYIVCEDGSAPPSLYGGGYVPKPRGRAG
jgi:glycosyltransferase involved in cell wall biosynthesis